MTKKLGSKDDFSFSSKSICNYIQSINQLRVFCGKVVL